MVVADDHSNVDHSGLVILWVNAYTPLIHLLHHQTTPPETIYLPGRA
jgi:sterol desaturase/sphingolipid hydroxylase (fatty acid hydroxylase superfamily)